MQTEPERNKMLCSIALTLSLGWASACAPAAQAQPAAPNDLASHAADAPSAELDAEEPEPHGSDHGADLGSLRTERIQVRFGNPDELARSLHQILDLRGPHDDGQVRAVLVDDRTNELVVIGSERGIQRVRAVLSPGVHADTSSSPLVLSLVHANAQQVARSVSPVIGGRARVIADEATNQLIVDGPETAQHEVERLVQTLDRQASAPSP